MKTYVEFGGTPEFRLNGAVLLYRGGRSAFATYHPAAERTPEDRPQLGEAQPLTTAFLRKLAGELGYRLPLGLIPPNVLGRTPDILV